MDEFAKLVETLTKELEYRRGLERQLSEAKGRYDMLFRETHPDIARKQDEAALEGEIRLLREQG